MSYLLDTCTISDFVKGQPADDWAAGRGNNYPDTGGDLTISDSSLFSLVSVVIAAFQEYVHTG